MSSRLLLLSLLTAVILSPPPSTDADMASGGETCRRRHDRVAGPDRLLPAGRIDGGGNLQHQRVRDQAVGDRLPDVGSGGGLRWREDAVYLPRGTADMNQVWQVGPAVSNGFPAKHEFSPGRVHDLVRGQSTVSVDSGIRKRNIHGILSAVSWGILLPMGAIVARYLKTFKSADPAWFYLHVSCQLIGYGVGVAGWATGLDLGKKSKGVQYTNHRNIGITLFEVATLQVFALLLRPNKDHNYCLYWNLYHHSIGYAVIVLGIINVFKGLEIESRSQVEGSLHCIDLHLGGYCLVA